MTAWDQSTDGQAFPGGYRIGWSQGHFGTGGCWAIWKGGVCLSTHGSRAAARARVVKLRREAKAEREENGNE